MANQKFALADNLFASARSVFEVVFIFFLKSETCEWLFPEEPQNRFQELSFSENR
jgi:hypothetical protein